MIQAATIHSCRKCNSRNIIKNGKNACGCQQYLCKDCGCYAVVQPKYRYSQKDKDVIIRAYQERSSMRGIERTFGVCRQTLSSLVKKKANQLPNLWQTVPKLQEVTQVEGSVEMDELWSFVGSKKNKVWVWIALDRTSRRVPGYALGDRSEKTCQKLWQNIPPYYHNYTCYTDFWEACERVIDPKNHQAVGKQSGQTAHIERWNNTLRQHLSPFVRKTLSFSKDILMHELCLKLFIDRYNTELLPPNTHCPQI